MKGISLEDNIEHTGRHFISSYSFEFYFPKVLHIFLAETGKICMLCKIKIGKSFVQGACFICQLHCCSWTPCPVYLAVFCLCSLSFKITANEATMPAILLVGFSNYPLLFSAFRISFLSPFYLSFLALSNKLRELKRLRDGDSRRGRYYRGANRQSDVISETKKWSQW